MLVQPEALRKKSECAMTKQHNDGCHAAESLERSIAVAVPEIHN
jgi:hypothetical protein